MESASPEFSIRKLDREIRLIASAHRQVTFSLSLERGFCAMAHGFIIDLFALLRISRSYSIISYRRKICLSILSSGLFIPKNVWNYTIPKREETDTNEETPFFSKIENCFLKKIEKLNLENHFIIQLSQRRQSV